MTIRGEVKRLTDDDDDEVIEALRRPVDSGLPPPESDAVEKTPAEVGEPFIIFRALLSGGDERRAGGAGTETGAATGEAGDIYNVAEVRRRLEGAGLMLVRTGGGLVSRRRSTSRCSPRIDMRSPRAAASSSC